MAIWPATGRSRTSKFISVTAALTAALLTSACSQSLTTSSSLGLGSNAPLSAEESKSDLQKATEYWGKEFAGDPRRTQAAVNYARNLKAMGQNQQAFAVLQQAATFNSDHRELLSEYGRLALEMDQVSLAEQVLSRADDGTKPDWKTVSARAAAMAKQGKYRDAIPHFERALTLSPDNPSILNNLGMAYAMAGEAAKAETYLQKAASLPSATPRVRQNLALVLGLQGKFDEAKTIAATDLPPERAAASVDYLQKMVDAAPAPAKPGQSISTAALKGAVASSAAKGWTTEVAMGDKPVPIGPPAK